MQDYNFDTMLKKVLKEEIDGQEIPPGAKERIRTNLGLAAKNKKAMKTKFIPVFAVSLVILVLLASLTMSAPASALNIKLLERLHFFVKDKIYNITESYGAEDQKAPVSPPAVTPNNRLTIEEAQTKLPFLLQTPSYLPPDVKLSDVKVTGDGSFKVVTLRYTTPEGSLLIEAQGNVENGGVGMMYDKEDTTVKNSMIHGLEATMLINNKGGRKTLHWQKQGIVYSIVGYYPAEEMIKIAESFSYREPK